MKPHRLDKDATIYNYTLVKKIRHRPLPLFLYGCLPLSAAAFLAASLSPQEALWIPAGMIVLPFIYSWIAWLYLKLTGDAERRSWTLGFRFPWLGLAPEQYVPLSLMQRANHQLLGIGLAAIVSLYPWIGLAHLTVMIALHVWFMLPRYLIFGMLHRAKKPGLLKIGPRDTSYYLE